MSHISNHCHPGSPKPVVAFKKGLSGLADVSVGIWPHVENTQSSGFWQLWDRSFLKTCVGTFR